MEEYSSSRGQHALASIGSALEAFRHYLRYVAAPRRPFDPEIIP